MQNIRFIPMPVEQARALTQGGLDAYGKAPEHSLSDGCDNPCRHCLGFIPKGAGMLTLAYRPFRALQPYAETGPIFLCAEACTPWQQQGQRQSLPPMLTSSPDYLLKAYSTNERILYGTGKITPSSEIEAYASQLLSREEVAFVDVRSARNNCFHLRIIRV
jgi:hypothetical protein